MPLNVRTMAVGPLRVCVEVEPKASVVAIASWNFTEEEFPKEAGPVEAVEVRGVGEKVTEEEVEAEERPAAAHKARRARRAGGWLEDNVYEMLAMVGLTMKI